MPRKTRHHYYEDEADDDFYDYDEEDENSYDIADDASLNHGKSDLEDLSKQPEVWECLICSYNNPISYYICEMCGVHKNVPPNEDIEAVLKVAEMPVGECKIWSCSACTYENSQYLPHCEMCGKPRSSFSNDIQEAASSTTGDSSQVNMHIDEESRKDAHISSNKESQDNSTSEHFQVIRIDAPHSSQKLGKAVKNGVTDDKYIPEPWIVNQQFENKKELLHLAIVGHVDAGKSTLTGRFLYLMGRVSQREMHKYEKEAKQTGKESFAYAWVLDESPEERERGVTMTVAVAHFDTNKYHVVLLDSPGHKDFVPNMILGASQADAAVLVVDSSMGAFEAGMDGGQGTGGQTKEHAQLVRSFGVEQLIVAVNKMDVVNYSKERFEVIKSQLGQFLRRCGFKETSLRWIPMSVIENQNLVSGATDARLKSWYTGPHFLEALDLFKPPTREIAKPLRLLISEVIQSRTLGPAAVSGKLESGAVKVGTKVLVMPIGEEAVVKAIERDGETLNVAFAGDYVDIGLQGVDSSCLMTGGVLCHPEFPVPLATCIELKVAVLDVKSAILCGSEVELHTHHAKEAAKITRILEILDPKTGLTRKKLPRLLTAQQNALLEVCSYRAICLEEYSKFRPLGRVTLRSTGRTIAVGVVTRIIEEQ